MAKETMFKLFKRKMACQVVACPYSERQLVRCCHCCWTDTVGSLTNRGV